ncbi:putative histidinol-phosphate phosphatase family protein [Magnetofaba australis IT-1]|uniref:Putative histidinol-phosphate phosphatase family protein n=1 Tax=Magnetofaba australis IT-1 TaxID=1434232 RepID=A0A1Y2K1M4_9PROT|nr:putative histidinol-phosphate phosphatase family protein [Magnetofaba australis IT-1]
MTLLILTYNEVEGMRVIMPQIDPAWHDELIIMDGGSTDGTLEYARAQGYAIHVQQQPGLGAAYLEGLARATGDIVILFSPDGNSDPARIPDLIEKMRQGYDLAIVSRYLDWAKSTDDDLVTGFGNWLFTKLYNVLFRQKVTDLLVIYRAFRRDLVQELGVDHTAISWTTQMMCKAAKQRKRIGEIPGDEPPRIGGVRKMNPLRNGWAELSMLLREFVRR